MSGAGAPAPPAHRRVLVVDDDADYRWLVRLALEGHPAFEVVGEAGDAAAAAAAAAEHRPDLVLLDCSMPPGDAFDGLPAIRAAAPGAQVVFLSGHDPADLRVASRAAGALGFLSKETAARDLASDLESLTAVVHAVQAVLDEARTRLGRGQTTPREARRFVREALRSWDLDALTDTVTLLVSELVTNAVVHAASDVEVLVRVTRGCASVEVSDASAAAPVPRRAEPSDSSGRGLALVEHLARRWGVRPRPGGGKTVWFEVDRLPDGTGEGLERAP